VVTSWLNAQKTCLGLGSVAPYEMHIGFNFPRITRDKQDQTIPKWLAGFYFRRFLTFLYSFNFTVHALFLLHMLMTSLYSDRSIPFNSVHFYIKTFLTQIDRVEVRSSILSTRKFDNLLQILSVGHFCCVNENFEDFICNRNAVSFIIRLTKKAIEGEMKFDSTARCIHIAKITKYIRLSTIPLSKYI
jgi:hypothetical protein